MKNPVSSAVAITASLCVLIGVIICARVTGARPVLLQVRAGDELRVSAGTHFACLASDLESRERWGVCVAARDEISQVRLLTEQRVRPLKSETRVLVLEPGNGIHRVRVLDGPHEPAEGYLGSAALQP